MHSGVELESNLKKRKTTDIGGQHHFKFLLGTLSELGVQIVGIKARRRVDRNESKQ